MKRCLRYEVGVAIRLQWNASVESFDLKALAAFSQRHSGRMACRSLDLALNSQTTRFGDVCALLLKSAPSRSSWVGDSSEEGPPDPIPNSEVKLLSADDTAHILCGKVGPRQPSYTHEARDSLKIAGFVVSCALWRPGLLAASWAFGCRAAIVGLRV